jgi:Swt1-like HEPN
MTDEFRSFLFRGLMFESEADTFRKAWLEGEKADLLGFADFGQLAQIVIAKWDHFKDIVPSQHWLKQRMDELEKARNFIAHNRMLLPAEFQRIYMYIADWNRAIGL